MLSYLNSVLAAILAASVVVGSSFAAPSENFKVFLCFGQSNIAGGSGVSPGTDDKKTTDRVMALAFNTCSNPSWQKDTWVPAREPLHCGDGGSGNNTMGPVYAFGKAMADSLPNDTIGVIPCGQSGVNIEVFMKNGGGCTAGYCIPYPGGNVYNWMLKKCQLAMERGVFAGIMLHQGESNSGQNDWPTKVKKIVDDLKNDLNITTNIPIVVGELLYSGACSGHNKIIANIPTTITNSYIASAKDLQGIDSYHFNAASYRTLGQRFAVEMMKGLHASGLITGTSPRQRVLAPSITPLQEHTAIYTLNGKLISSGSGAAAKTRFAMQPGNMYIVVNQATGAGAKLMMAPAR